MSPLIAFLPEGRMSCTSAVSGKWESNLFSEVSSDGGSEQRAAGDDTQGGKAGWRGRQRCGEPVNQEELGARVRECEKKKQKRGKNLCHNIYKKNLKNVEHRTHKLEQGCLSGIN